MKTVSAHRCVCQDCNSNFYINRQMINVINLDEDKDACVDFIKASVNRVTCPKCNANFTYEIPMLIFSCKDRFAIKVEPAFSPENSSEDFLPGFFNIFDFKYRKVSYYIEALEKVRAFKDGLDDRYIEYVKLRFFSDEDATPMDDVNLCYKASDNNNLYFEKLDYNGFLLKDFQVLKDDVLPCIFSDEPQNPVWQQINRYTINDYIVKEN